LQVEPAVLVIVEHAVGVVIEAVVAAFERHIGKEQEAAADADG
jgi:hypothetical protein